MGINERMNYYYDEFSENEKHVCRYLASHYPYCARLSINQFAKNCNVSKTMLVRFAKKIGLSGYSELKARIMLEMRESVSDAEGLLQNVTDSYHKMLDDLMKKDFSHLFERLYLAEKVFVYGSGSSQSRAASEMKRIFLPVKEMIHVHGHDMQYAIQNLASPQDLAIIISLSGESEAVIELARALKTKNVYAVSITKLGNNTLSSLCKENLYINSIRFPAEFHVEYEITTPYFLLIEFLYLSYRYYLSQQ